METKTHNPEVTAAFRPSVPAKKPLFLRRNVFVMGSGRSGTSMVAGCLEGQGWHRGDGVYPANPANPKGFFESWEVNMINEDLLAPFSPGRPSGPAGWFFRGRPLRRQRWLSRVSPGASFEAGEELAGRMRTALSLRPYCFKDTRFCYTLPAWRPYLKDTVFVCVFRDPAETVDSILTECREAPYLQSLRMTPGAALQVWTLMYRHILEKHRFEGEWLFVHYRQLFTESGLRRLEAFTGSPVNPGFPEQGLSRAKARHPVTQEARNAYRMLCLLAGVEINEGKVVN